jgi:hydrogenase expression/formation protein HypE
MGKLPVGELTKLLNCIKKDRRVIISPMTGYDSGVHLMGDKYVVVSTDPCIGVPDKWFGWLLIHYAASDVALFGAKPEFCTVNLLGSLSTKHQTFQRTMVQACNATDKLDMTIVAGHTGKYAGFSGLLGVCTAYGTVTKEKLITPGAAQAGDLILCTKSVGLEILANFSLTRKRLAQELFSKVQSEKLARLVCMQSCVREALQLADSGCVNAMHDATEGGLVAALNEMAGASRLGFEVEMKKFPISREVRLLQDRFKLSDEQVLAMSSTGTILAAVGVQDRKKVEEILRRNSVSTSFLGKFTENKKRLLKKNEHCQTFPQVADDPYNRILSLQV